MLPLKGASPLKHKNYQGVIIQVEYESQKIEMRLWDTAGQEDYERLRILAYEGVDVVVMCFSLVNKNSFDNILDKWLPEYRQHLSGVPVRICEEGRRKPSS